MNVHTSYVGHEVVGRNQETVGTVTDVLFDSDNEPRWLVVKPGILNAERYVPVDRSYESAEGDIVVPFDKKWIKEAPKADDHILTEAVELEACEHYGVRLDDRATAVRYLLLVDGAVDGEVIRTRLRTVEPASVVFHAVVPTRDLTSGERHMVEVENETPHSATSPSVVAAEWRLRSTLDALRAAGFENVTGSLGDPDPVDAIVTELETDRFDVVIAVTKSIGASGWVHLDLPHRISRHIDEPVVHIEVDG